LRQRLEARCNRVDLARSIGAADETRQGQQHRAALRFAAVVFVGQQRMEYVVRAAVDGAEGGQTKPWVAPIVPGQCNERLSRHFTLDRAERKRQLVADSRV